MARVGYSPKNADIKTDVKRLEVDRAFGAHFQVQATKATVTSNTSVHAAVTLGATGTDVSTAITNPNVPRNIVIKGNASGMIGDVGITGTNYNDEVITEVLTVNGATAVVGAKAFKTVTLIQMPGKTNASGDTISVGTGEKLGLPYLLSHNTVYLAFKDNVKEANAPTVTVSATAIESNTIDLDSALNSKIVDVYLIV